MIIPKTVDEAVQYFMDNMVEKEKNIVRKHKKEDLIQYHHDWGRWIRNNFNLWKGNPELMKYAGVEHPDDASMIIIEKFWEKLQETV